MEQAETVHGTGCPVAPLAEEAFTVIAAINREGNEAARLRASAAVHAQRQLDVLDDRLNGITDAAARDVASSGSGALFQIHLISALVDNLSSWVPNEGSRAVLRDRATRDITRMLYSLQSYVEGMSGADAVAACCQYYMNREFNPHMIASTAIAEQREQHACA